MWVRFVRWIGDGETKLEMKMDGDEMEMKMDGDDDEDDDDDDDYEDRRNMQVDCRVDRLTYRFQHLICT